MGVGGERIIRFGSYELHPTQGLRRGGRELRVTQKALRVLYLLAGRPGEVVTKEEIFDTVWPGVSVSDAALTSCIKELRRVLKDDARSPRFIETRHRVGFRFLAVTVTESAPTAAETRPVADDHGKCAGRAAALAELNALLEQAVAGARRLVVVHGEAGIGKTTLVDAFLQGIPDGNVLAAAAACVEAYGAIEPYGPLLDAARSLCGRSGDRDRILLLRQHAPTWWAQFPAFHDPSDAPAVDRYTAGVTRERMSRELSDYLEAVAAERPLVLWIDDVHWADDRTLDWIGAFAARRGRARVLLIVTLRDGYHAHADHLFAGMAAKPWCTQLRLAGLDETATRQLVERRRAAADASVADLAARLHALTEGHPLFIGALLDELKADGSAIDWTPVHGQPAARAQVNIPTRIRALIDEQIDRLSASEAQVLEVASLIAAPVWTSALVAAGVAGTADDVETLLMRLARRGAFIRHAGSEAWPDGTISERFAFRHAIHREVFGRRVTGRRQADIHQRIGMRLEQAFATTPPELALALAWHFEQAGDVERTTRYLTDAARSANRMGAGEEAIRHLTRALSVLHTRPPSTERDEQEVELQMLLGGAAMAVHGWGAPEVDRAYQRAHGLCDGLASTAHHFPTYWGLWLFRWGRGELSLASDLLTVLQRTCDAAPDPMRRLQVLHGRWATAYCLGQFEVAVDCAARGWSLSRQEVPGEATLSYGNHHAGVCARAFAARALASLGRCVEAKAAADEAVREARRFSHPFSLALTLVFAAATAQLLRAPADVAAHADEAEAISEAHGFRLLLAWARALKGWALSVSGQPAQGVGMVSDAVSAALRTGSGQFRTLFLCLLAEAHLEAGEPAQGLAAIQDACEFVRSTGERFHEAELHRLEGELLAAQAPSDPQRIVEAFERGVAAARQQGAQLFAVRNLIALARYQASRGEVAGSRPDELRAAMARVAGLPAADREACEALAL